MRCIKYNSQCRMIDRLQKAEHIVRSADSPPPQILHANARALFRREISQPSESLYIPGLDPMDEVATVAAINILGQVAKKAGQYETRLVVPNRDPIVMAVAQQVVRESYSAVGKPHLYRQEDVFYVTYSQFGFAAAVAGLMMRDKPATNFFMGHFYAESLVLAETGNATGAIQIAGTDCLRLEC